jgi:hypothetical protein
MRTGARLGLGVVFACGLTALRGASSPEPVVTPGCLADEVRAARLAADPTLARLAEAAEARLQETIAARARSFTLRPEAGAGALFIIPVAVHIIHVPGTPVGTAENISYTQVLSQIEATNRDLRNLPGIGPPAADSQIELALATIPPPGHAWYNPAEPGVTRTADLALVDHEWPAEEPALKAVEFFPSDHYLNIWVIRAIDHNGVPNVAGYGTYPGPAENQALSGIVMDRDTFGANNVQYGPIFNLLPTYEQGKVLVHEIGHYLDLLHTFEGGCVSPGDLVGDTPAIHQANVLCPGIPPDSCPLDPGADEIRDHMDYTNDVCRELFTPGQVGRMQAALLNFRASLVDLANLVATGCSSGALPTIAVDRTDLHRVTPQFTTATTATTYTWSFPGGTPPSVFDPAPADPQLVTYSVPGVYNVSLTVDDGLGNINTLTKSQLVFVTSCAPIAGPQGYWCAGKNVAFDFSSGLPVAESCNITGAEGCATQSDASGQRLYYTDGAQVWDKHHAVMPNGSGLLGNSSASQGVVSFPVPGNSGRYYLFTVPAAEDGVVPNPLRYSIVDPTLGLYGDVVAGMKNLVAPLPRPRPPFRGGRRGSHCNGTDRTGDHSGASHQPGEVEEFLPVITAPARSVRPWSPPGPAARPATAPRDGVSPDGSLLAGNWGPTRCFQRYRFDREPAPSRRAPAGRASSTGTTRAPSARTRACSTPGRSTESASRRRSCRPILPRSPSIPSTRARAWISRSSSSVRTARSTSLRTRRAGCR